MPKALNSRVSQALEITLRLSLAPSCFILSKSCNIRLERGFFVIL